MQIYVDRNDKGSLTVRGSRISLSSIVKLYLEGESAETIREAYPTLSLPAVYGAITHYLENQGEIDEELASELSKVKQMREAASARNHQLRQRLKSTKVQSR
ncbi:MAG: DUF433 domain-containing protein [Planctomycetota bacterium]|jgi:uncharacterized protein (DUF433 family)|nr:DUF433 domain-containing protein [Planctomycetota bacterium]MDP7254031.1 DUF433 domain-containing protein [Planctomycetota bacterium]